MLNQNMVTNRPSTGRILTSLASLDSWHSQLSNDAKIIISRAILMHFVAMFCIFRAFWSFSYQVSPKCVKNADFLVEKNRPKMTKNHNVAAKCINIARLMMILVSLESWECQLPNDAKLVKIHTIEGRFAAMFRCVFTYRIYGCFFTTAEMPFDQDPHFNL